MATSAEIMEALEDYKTQCNTNKRLRRMQRDWTKLIHFVSEDTGDSFTMDILKGEIMTVKEGKEGTPDVIVMGTSEDMCDMFWGDLNPAQKYLDGEIRVKASQEDVQRIDAITMIIWPDV